MIKISYLICIGLLVLYFTFNVILDVWIYKNTKNLGLIYDVWLYRHSRVNNTLSHGQTILFKTTVVLEYTVIIATALTVIIDLIIKNSGR